MISIIFFYLEFSYLIIKMSYKQKRRSTYESYSKHRSHSENHSTKSKLNITLNDQNELNPKLYEEKKDKRFF